MALSLPHEAFVSGIAAGLTREDAYKSAGYKVTSARSACVLAQRLLQRPEIKEAIERAKAERARIKAEATKLAIERSAITMERVAVELGRIGFANMMDYMRIGPTGDPVLDWSSLTREQAAALTEVTVDDYIDGRGENARDVRKVKFKLGDKRASLMDIAKLFGWIIERRENKIVDEFDTMTIEQVEAWLDEQAERRLKVRPRSHEARTPRRQPAAGIGTRRPTTAQGKPH
jgi:phage terminase small subunit